MTVAVVGPRAILRVHAVIHSSRVASNQSGIRPVVAQLSELLSALASSTHFGCAHSLFRYPLRGRVLHRLGLERPMAFDDTQALSVTCSRPSERSELALRDVIRVLGLVPLTL